MSWSRILRFAKERQVPVIVTDETGEDPMILLSLDALEAALDGGASPVAPPQPPAPVRSTTPSFVPDPAFEADEESADEQDLFSEPTSSVDLEDISVPPSLESRPEVKPEPAVPLAAAEEPGDDDMTAEVVQIQPRIVDEPAPVASVKRDSNPLPAEPAAAQTDIQIMTPPEEASVPVVQELSVSTPSEATPAAPAGMSLEERFFLDF